jgi:hypothetical protein
MVMFSLPYVDTGGVAVGSGADAVVIEERLSGLVAGSKLTSHARWNVLLRGWKHSAEAPLNARANPSK